MGTFGGHSDAEDAAFAGVSRTDEKKAAPLEEERGAACRREWIRGLRNVS